MNIRSLGFWFVDRFKGGYVRRHLAEIDSFFSRGINDPERIRIQSAKLETLLKYATDKVPFYKDYKGWINIEQFPVVDKNIIRNSFDQFLSTEFSESERIASVTSGSTGTPFKVYFDKNKRYRNTSDTMYFAGLAGFHVGERLYYFKIWSGLNKKSKFIQKSQNIVPVEVLQLSDCGIKVLKDLERHKVRKHLLGYVSAFETLCRIIDGLESKPNFGTVGSIITMSESLNTYTKTKVEEYFDVTPLSRYSNIENGIVAQQTVSSHGTYVLNAASYHIEILAINSDNPVPLGTPGRIVVTDFYNRAMPFIRYDTGDIGTMEVAHIEGINVLVLSKVEGRKMDQIFDTKGSLISSFIVYKNMWKYTEVTQYQFQQIDKKRYCIELCVDKAFKRAEEMIQEFRQYLGNDAEIVIKYVEEIPLLASGKRKKVVNLMKC